MGHGVVTNPMAAFLNWFDTLPRDFRQRLAHMFMVCTAPDARDMMAPPGTSLARFLNGFKRRDFPLRIVARMFTVRSLFDLLLIHRRELTADPEKWLPDSHTDNMTPLAPYRWEKIYKSWGALRSRELSDAYVHAWAAAVLKKKQP